MAGFRIAQITDLHVGGPDERPRDVDVRGNLERVLPAVKAESPDHIVISGDLSFRDGDREAYRYVRGQVEALGVPYSVIGGNHDISVNLAEEFDRTADLHGEELYYTLPVGGSGASAELLFLDSVKATVSDTQLGWLRERLDEAQHRVIVFMHHPPILCDCRYMDEHYPFTRSADIVPVLTSSPALSAIFCGHYHAEARTRLPGRGDVSVHVTPSLWFQIDRTSEEMVISDTRPAYCVIELKATSVRARVEYLEPVS